MIQLRNVSPNFETLVPEHPLAQKLTESYRWYSPSFSPRDVPRFADIGSITENAECMMGIRDLLVARYRAMPQPPTHILGFDARGFLIGPMIAVELGIPFVLMRKAEKNAGLLIKSEPYAKEYAEAAPEVMTIRNGAIEKGSRVVLIDDLLATGGTALSGLQLVEASGATALEVTTVMSLPFLKGVEHIHSIAGGRYKDVVFFSLLSDDALTERNCGDVKGFTGPRVMSCSEVLAKNN